MLHTIVVSNDICIAPSYDEAITKELAVTDGIPHNIVISKVKSICKLIKCKARVSKCHAGVHSIKMDQ